MQLNYPATVVPFRGNNSDYQLTDGICDLDDVRFPKRILCEGDSWISLGGFPSGNILFPMRFSQDTLLVNLSKPGDTIEKMSIFDRHQFFPRLITKFDGEVDFSIHWDAIFISGGGNDLIDATDKIICKPSKNAGGSFLDYVDRTELKICCASVKKGYRTISEMRRGGKNEKTPIVTHTYDYFTPRDVKAAFLGLVGLSGPWFHRAFVRAGVPISFWIQITDYLVESLAGSLLELAQELSNFYVIDTRNTLLRADLDLSTPGAHGGDWINEIHPNVEGYKKLAQVISPKLNAVINS